MALHPAGPYPFDPQFDGMTTIEEFDTGGPVAPDAPAQLPQPVPEQPDASFAENDLASKSLGSNDPIDYEGRV